MHITNRSFLSLIILLIILTLQSQSFAETALDSRWVDGQFKGFNLGNAKASKINEKDIPRLQKYGANLLRIGLRITKDSGSTNYKIDKVDEVFLDKIIASSKGSGISVVITLGIEPSGNKSDYWNNNATKIRVGEIWKELALKYKGNVQVVGFDLLNEPVIPRYYKLQGRDIWREWALDWSGRIRDADPNRTIIFEPAPWALPDGFANLQPLPIPNVVYSLHFYSPREITHQGIYSYPLGVDYPGNVGFPPRYWDYSQLYSILKHARKFSFENKVPIYVGEFSCIRYASANSRFKYVQDAIEIFEKEGWSWTFHSFKEWDGWDPEIEGNSKSLAIRLENGPLINLLSLHMRQLTRSHEQQK
ncbi:MAG: hypothetical protein CTY12_02570 [Methylotenera sp.]|nr:MAG: hypothetical protein CTY12_02570 [Methylotenera sp.]